jgi:hypothetical protein
MQVVMALTSGRVRRARLQPDGSIRAGQYADYVNVREDGSARSKRTPAIAAALAIWLSLNPMPERERLNW